MERSSDIQGTGWLWGGVILTGLAGYLLLFAPNSLLGFETGLPGSLLMVLGLGAALYGAHQRPTDPESRVSFGEKAALVEFLSTLLIALYLLVKFQAIGWEADWQDPALQKIVVNILLMVVGSALLVHFLREREIDETVEDERDEMIRQRAAQDGYTALVTLLLVAIVTIGFSPPGRLPLPFTPLAVAHALIGVLLLSEVVRHGREYWLYRQARQ